MTGRITAVPAVVLVTVAAALAGAVPASAATYEVSGRQVTIDADAGTYRMFGGLVGRWWTTSIETTAQSPLLEMRGTESFSGCLDRRRDRSCAGDPSGTLSFSFISWAKNDPADPASLIWGACWHQAVTGTGAFAGAEGVVTFVDTPTRRGVQTKYIGNVTLDRSRAAQARVPAARAATTATLRTCGAPRPVI
jgi:hypothetical protein